MFRFLTFWLLIIVLTACDTTSPPAAQIIIVATESPPATAVPTLPPVSATPTTALVDALPVLSGICFEAANDAVGQVFVIRNEAELVHLYDLADNARLCSQPVNRYGFDFSNGTILVGLWSRGVGCTARHDVLSYERTDTTITIQLRFVTEGACPYELVRPYWVGIPQAQAHDVQLSVVE